MEHQFIRTNGITLHVVVDGDPKGEPILFLHGFPEFWYGWRKQMAFFVEQGYRVIVPDQRGYNQSDKPAQVEAYKINVLATDIDGLIEALGYEQVHLVGHDWGAAVSWWVATMYPHRLKTLTILNVPYPTIMLKHFQQGNIGQLLKSWYIGFFQIPFIPEALVSLFDYKGFANAIKSTGLPTTFSDEELDKYREAWARPQAMTSMMNWYRAMGRTDVKRDVPREQNLVARGTKLTVPTLMLWGEQDVALSKEMAQPSIDLCAEGELIFFPNATHWLQHDEPDAVNQHILAHITKAR